MSHLAATAMRKWIEKIQTQNLSSIEIQKGKDFIFFTNPFEWEIRSDEDMLMLNIWQEGKHFDMVIPMRGIECVSMGSLHTSPPQEMLKVSNPKAGIEQMLIIANIELGFVSDKEVFEHYFKNDLEHIKHVQNKNRSDLTQPV